MCFIGGVAFAQSGVAPTPRFAAYVVDSGRTVVLFDASKSSDADGSIVTYQWAFGDGFSGAGQTKEHAYAHAGEYEVTLRVVDNAGRSSMATQNIDLSTLPVRSIGSSSVASSTSTAQQSTSTGQQSTSTAQQSTSTGQQSTVVPVGLTSAPVGPGAPTVEPRRQPRLDLPVGSRVGMRAPEFSLATFDDDLVRLSDFLGQTVIVEFWSSACNGCRTSMPHLESIRRQYEPLGLAVITISVDPSPSDARSFLIQGGYTGFVALREMNPSNKVTMHAYGVSWIPHAFLIDRQGVIRYSGYMWELTSATIEPWL